MTQFTINIAITEIANAVYRLTANAEKERGDDAHIATADNEDLISGFVVDGVHLLNDAVEFYGSAQKSGENVSIVVDMPTNWPNEGEILKDTARVFLENYAVARWFELSGTADRFNNAANVALERLAKILEKRTKPSR